MISRKKLNRLVSRFPIVITNYRRLVKLRNNRVRNLHVAMFHAGRCGSTVLGMMLNKHPDIHWGNEVFLRYMNNDKCTVQQSQKFVKDEIHWNQSASVSKIYGFETKFLPFQHLSKRCIDLELSEYLDCLRALQFTKFIILKRENYLRRVVSAEVARHNNFWHARSDVDGSTNPNTIYVDINCVGGRGPRTSLLDSFRHLDEQYEKLQKLLEQDNGLLLTYEDDIQDDPFLAYHKVCEFMSVYPRETEVSLRRTNPFALERLINNFDEITSVLGNTEYEWMLEA